MIAIKSKNAPLSENASKFFGEALVPESFLNGDEIALGEVFLCQINLEELKAVSKETPLPDSGFLYFFIDFDFSPAKGVVRYALSPDCVTPLNEGSELDYDVETEIPISFSIAEEAENGLFSSEKKLHDDEVCLLKFTPSTLGETDFLEDVDGSLLFVIKKVDLKNGAFDKAYLINVSE